MAGAPCEPFREPASALDGAPLPRLPVRLGKSRRKNKTAPLDQIEGDDNIVKPKRKIGEGELVQGGLLASVLGSGQAHRKTAQPRPLETAAIRARARFDRPTNAISGDEAQPLPHLAGHDSLERGRRRQNCSGRASGPPPCCRESVRNGRSRSACAASAGSRKSISMTCIALPSHSHPARNRRNGFARAAGGVAPAGNPI